MRQRRLLAVLVGGALAIGAVGARAEIVQKGSLRVAFDGELSPHTLPRSGSAPVAVSIGGRITTANGAPPPQLRTISIAINRNGRLSYAGLPVCRLDQIQPSTNQGALGACRGSLIGEGTFAANVAFAEQTPFPSKGKILAFNGREKGRPVVFAHVYGTDPVPTSSTLSFAIKATKGTFGTALTASLPQATGEWGYVTGMELSLDRRYSFAGKRHSYLSAGCPAPKGFPGAVFPLIRASFAFAGGRSLSSTLTRSCRARG